MSFFAGHWASEVSTEADFTTPINVRVLGVVDFPKVDLHPGVVNHTPEEMYQPSHLNCARNTLQIYRAVSRDWGKKLGWRLKGSP